MAAQEVPLEFNARFSAQGKTYAYDFQLGQVRDPLLINRAWFVGSNIDWEAIKEALPDLMGEMDFQAFQSTGGDLRSTVRVISQAELTAPSESLRRLTLTGSGFLRHMVRTIAGTLMLIGRRRLAHQDLSAIIKSRDRSLAGPTAPPQGLYLIKVYYADF
jgi:tRNA pseudouridine38-40 synthase